MPFFSRADPDELRHRMVRDQLEARGICDRRVLRAMEEVPRERFVPERVRERAYDDGALPIGDEQTISQPYVVGMMAEALEIAPSDRVLEVGAGSGYAAAVLGKLAAEVFAVERIHELAARASRVLDELGYDNVQVVCADGTKGLPEEAPFDVISVAAAAPEVPPALREQLAPGGRMILPLGDSALDQWLVRIYKGEDGGFIEEKLLPVRFVPLIPVSEPED